MIGDKLDMMLKKHIQLCKKTPVKSIKPIEMIINLIHDISSEGYDEKSHIDEIAFCVARFMDTLFERYTKHRVETEVNLVTKWVKGGRQVIVFVDITRIFRVLFIQDTNGDVSIKFYEPDGDHFVPYKQGEEIEDRHE